jgi:sulfate/thiosulfate transport system ATP-binding protein
VAVRDSAEDLSCPLLGQAVVDQRSFVGSYERLRLRLPPLPGVRAIAPPVPFGSDSIWIEATRSQDQARRFPLRPGDSTWVGVQRVHALVHPGLRFLLLTNGSACSRAALVLGGEIARLAHARVTVLGHGSPAGDAERHLQEAREQLGSGLAALDTRVTWEDPAEAVAGEVERRPCDLVVLSLPPREGVELAGEVLRAGQHHLLLVPAGSEGRGVPRKVLICVAVGEPGKEDVSFTARLVRHLGAEATILTVLPDGAALLEAQAERFLAGSARTLRRQGVPVETRIRQGGAREEILAELASGGYDLLVLGVPLPGRDGELKLGGIVGRLLADAGDRPVLMVQSPEAAS